MNGTVTLSLADYESMKDISNQAAKEKALLVQAAKELEVFLSFLTSRVGLDDHVEEFNKYSKKSQITIIDGKAKIKIIGLEID
jgi:hypothetical protein